MVANNNIPYLELGAMAIGTILIVSGDVNTGILVFGIGAVVHFGFNGLRADS